MKIWTMPQIVVDAFTPNDYVAACAEALSVKAGTIYWDARNTLSWNNQNDGLYQSQEQATGTGGNTMTVNSKTPTGWRSGVDFYSAYRERWMLVWVNYYDSNDALGTYDVYVFNDHTAYVYQTGSANNFTPSQTGRNFTS